MAKTPSSVKVSNPSMINASQTKSATKPQSKPQPKPASNQTSSAQPWPWKTLLGLGLIIIELLLQTGIISGLFMLLWAIIGINSKQTYILEVLRRELHPILYWFTIHLWLLLAAALFMSHNQVYGIVKLFILKLVELFI